MGTLFGIKAMTKILILVLVLLLIYWLKPKKKKGDEDMGFFRELIDAAKEGAEEGKAELAQEEAEADQLKDDEKEALWEKINTIPYDERFAVALAAPFRTDIFMDWFSVFKSTREDPQEDVVPYHLYTFGGDLELEDIDRQRMTQGIKDGFEVTDFDSAISVIGDLFDLGRIPTDYDFPPSQKMTSDELKDQSMMLALLNDHITEDNSVNDMLALIVVMVTMCITSATDLGYIEKSTAMILLKDVNIYVKSMYKGEGSFERYGEDFLAGEALVKLNKKKERKRIEQYIENLNFKAGSPWKHIEFNREEDKLFDFDEVMDIATEMYMLTEDEMEVLENHYEEYFGKVDDIFHEVLSPDVHIDIAIVKPTEDRPYYSLITEGMSAFEMNAPEKNLSRGELMINLPADWKVDNEDEQWYWPIRALKTLPRYALNENTWLGWGHSVPTGAPVTEGSKFSGFVLLNPMAGGDGCQTTTLPNGNRVNIYQLVPITDDEMDYKIENGTSALVEKLLENNDFSSINVVDVDRWVIG